ncbi:hypothetical protein LOZ61_004806 [Ophidiomyces ophidiicola]|nr:hypothetical protein LOZ61_004806 [Ophidiomyces ophidiicola]KAI1924641.1 hypothetical protein LOZ60_004561 [Ophidiomyces ophidiicola]KAI1955048.1 hypothetical protein LOZ59_004724 [Ophidiomyces ophidiicola]KAI2021548.1 hypothetical protein LOZ45_004690 [Ophidiomyces ophidiicola]KAI2035937.1 hypothetical protein LOZ48_001096 [Ophidiomyces ophidiicola]
MDDQDGISIRAMRLKVLYTFDDESRTNCLARWPHLLEIQTAFLDEDTQVGVIELKTCIQAIVSASPELVAKLGRDYTVYAYDYSEYETPLVGQGMLSWVLASASPTPNAPAHQSKTMVTGRVCTNPGLFARGSQETLEVKLKLVPVPTVLQSEYLNSMQKYRDLSNMIPQDFDAQAWTNFVQANPGLFAGNGEIQSADRDTSVMNMSGIENVHRILSEGSTPRDISNMNSFRADSPAQFASRVPSRTSTPALARPTNQQNKRTSDDIFRPSSRASVQSANLNARRRGSIMSGYGSSDETTEGPVQKRAKLMRADLDKTNLNIERQPGSLRVAASTAASVRIHRPTPLNPSIQPQASTDEPIRPPTPVPSLSNAPNRRLAPAGQSGLRRQSSTLSQRSQASLYIPDDRRVSEMSATSPEEQRYGAFSETPFNMPSSPPIMDMACPQTSSPVLPPLPNQDSGFMSGTFEPLDDDNSNEYNNFQQPNGNVNTNGSQILAISKTPSANGGSNGTLHHRQLMSDGVPIPASSAPTLPPQPRKAIGSRPSSRASIKQSSKPLAPAPAPTAQRQTDVIPSSSLPPISTNVAIPPAQGHQSDTQSYPMSDMATASTPAPVVLPEKIRSGAGARRVKQVQARLDQCIKQGTVPPYCENCGAIETTTWRRAWSKVIEGNTEDANACINDTGMLFWEPVDTESDGSVTSYRQFKKSLANEDKDYIQLLLCNPCGLWLHKFKNMRPENKWNKPPPKDKRKRKSNRKLPPVPATSTRSQVRLLAAKRPDSSPPPSEASSPNDDETTPKSKKNSGKKNDAAHSRSKKRRANSAEPARLADKNDRWQQEDAFEALRRAIQSSPARNLEVRKASFTEPNLTPNPVRRTLFPSIKEDNAMKVLSDALINSARRSPRSSPKKSANTKSSDNKRQLLDDGLDHLFEGDDDKPHSHEVSNSPTPRQKRQVNPHIGNKENVSTPQTQPPTQEICENQQGPEQISDIIGTHMEASRNSVFWNSPNSRSFETIDGLIFNIFQSDEGTLGDLDSFHSLHAPKDPGQNEWADWDTSDYVSPGVQHHASEVEIDPSLHANLVIADTNVEIPELRETNKKDIPPNTAAQPSEEEFRSLLASTCDYATFNDSSAISDSDIFDPALVDPHLLSGMWSKDDSITTSPSKINSTEPFDAEVISAIIQEVATGTTSV